MKTTVPDQQETTGVPILSSQNQGWENILVEQFQHPAGEGWCHFSDDRAINLSLAPRPVSLMQIQGGKTYTALYGKGDISVTPAKMPFFARWDRDDRYLQIRVASGFMKRVASEVLERNFEHLELLAQFQTRDPQLEAIAMLLLAELQQENLGGKLYVESLANLLAVHLLRFYFATQPRVAIYESGLTQRQLLQVLEYINEYLSQQIIKLADLANLLGMSQFHFSHLFKRSLGIAPHQYLLQQRVERAKQLLKQTDRSIIDIAFLCGFNSHSHLSKQFRQLTGITPKAYRAQ
ncbi:helix-turn-helix domain-containing protein [Chroococcidiopsis sp. TS-821]|uniref:AraC family transcriptional regulator n=1 Tax=Chroococcidiopsis sp. TS-821 TaxID=1378066 RepID=UPI000CED8B68|nr:helix-turn-helix domain-containing protein [Chroococcidiopsis sp. TS-821]PPS40638.1 AraC family transcriptional regulator [Chroococcidiopsis sp. TS-821]